MVIEPPHVALLVQLHAAHVIVKSAPTRCLVGALVGHGASPSWAMQTVSAEAVQSCEAFVDG